MSAQSWLIVLPPAGSANFAMPMEAHLRVWSRQIFRNGVIVMKFTNGC